MRYSYFVFSAILATYGESFAFQPMARQKISSKCSTTRLNMKLINNRFWGHAASTLAGLAFAGQVASATLPVDNSIVYQEVPTLTTSAVEVLDFSMPSYESSIKGSTLKSSDSSPPVFNPFGDFQPEIIKPTSETSKGDFEIPKVEIPKKEMPKMEMPTMEIPKIDMPKMDMPKMDMPKMDMPKMDIPKMDMPKMDMPKMDIPKMDIPKMDMPKMDMPKMDMPKMDVPKMDMPKIDMPEIPKMDMPDMPKMSLPSFSLPKLGETSETQSVPAPVKVYSPQEVRDEAARVARQAYLQADEEAKEIEAQARAARERASDKLQEAKVAKDLACETRPGGKILCLRNPFAVGY